MSRGSSGCSRAPYSFVSNSKAERRGTVLGIAPALRSVGGTSRLPGRLSDHGSAWHACRRRGQQQHHLCRFTCTWDIHAPPFLLPPHNHTIQAAYASTPPRRGKGRGRPYMHATAAVLQHYFSLTGLYRPLQASPLPGMDNRGIAWPPSRTARISLLWRSCSAGMGVPTEAYEIQNNTPSVRVE